MPRAIWSVYSPLSICGIPAANSTISMPRATSPWASEKVLPCSRTMMRAKSSARCWIRCRKRNSTRARVSGGVLDQAGKAATPAFTAASTSSAVPSATCATGTPWAGLKTSA